MFNQSLFTYLVRAMVLLTAIPIHECAHAWASNKLGDPTAKNLGRLTLNPLPHLDLIGSVLMLFTGFGWAKPVPVTTRNFKNVKKGMILTALAGPAANILRRCFPSSCISCGATSFILFSPSISPPLPPSRRSSTSCAF